MSFTLDIKNFVEKAKKNPETVARQVSFKLFSAVIKASPVDTGRFRMNWQTAGSVAPSGVIDGTDKGGAAAIGDAASYIFAASDWNEFTLTNNLPYAEVIEFGGYKSMFGFSNSFMGPVMSATSGKTINGYSTQAPQGVVRVNVARFNTLLEEEAAKVR